MITMGYASIFAFFYVWLSLNVIRTRGVVKQALGDGGDSKLQQRIRAHANFAEYVPITLLLLILLEQQQLSNWLLHGLAITLLIARLLHAYSVLVHEKYKDGKLLTSVKFRVRGMQLTLAVIIIAALCALGLVIQHIIGNV